MSKLHLDFETFSEVDLTKVGAYVYAQHPSTRVDLIAFALDEHPPEIWDRTDPATPDWPLMLIKWLNDPHIEIHAFNAQFERLMLHYVLKQVLPISRFHCVMVKAWSLSFAGGLAMVGDQLGLAGDKAKTAEGKKLVLKFCKPAPKNHLVHVYNRENTPEGWARYKEYCKQDVVAEREISKLLAPYPTTAFERRMWIVDQKINDRGMPIDLDVVRGAVQIYHEEKARLKEKMNTLTGLGNANSTQQLLPWLAERGVDMPDLTKDSVVKAMEQAPKHEVAYQVLALRQQSGKSSPAKWEALLRATLPEGVLCGAFAFGGAQRTQRWAGRLFQPQNLPRPKMDNVDQLTHLLATGDLSLVAMIVGEDNVMDFLADNLRCAIAAPKGQKLVVSDLSSIESRVLGWTTGCARINRIFAEGKDTYRDLATELFHVSYDEVTKQQRSFSKAPCLGSGYMLGAKGLRAYAEGYGVEMGEDEAQRVTDIFRSVYFEIPAAWDWLKEAFFAVIEHRETEMRGCGVRIYRDTNFLFMELPSGRSIAYFRPQIQMRVPPWEAKKVEEADAIGEVYIPREIPAITYLGLNQYSRRWERQSTHPGKIIENGIQGISRDILAEALVAVDESDGPMATVLHVHDEIGALVPEATAEAELENLDNLLATTPGWAPGLLLGAAGFATRRYRKD